MQNLGRGSKQSEYSSSHSQDQFLNSPYYCYHAREYLDKDNRFVDDTKDTYLLLYDDFLINRKIFERKNHSVVETSVTI